MTLVLPGSAQVAAGNRRVGRIASDLGRTVGARLLVGGRPGLAQGRGAPVHLTAALGTVQVLMIALGLG